MYAFKLFCQFKAYGGLSVSECFERVGERISNAQWGFEIDQGVGEVCVFCEEVLALACFPWRESAEEETRTRQS